MFVSFGGTIGNGGNLGYTGTGNHARGADAAGTDTYLDAACARLDQRFGRCGGCHIAGDDGKIGIGMPDVFQHIYCCCGMCMRSINGNYVRLGVHQRGDAGKAVRGDPHGGGAEQAAICILGGMGVFGGFFQYL